MMIENVLIKRLGVKLPIIQAPMASATTPEMVISAARSGALGSLGAAYMSPAEMVSAIRKIRGEVDHQ
jgi:nitronate monooxygenase